MELTDILNRILKAETREEVSALLFGLWRSTLVDLASKLDIYHTNKSKELIKDAIIECTIGAKLRSMVTHNLRLNGR